jgi:hypothetical protein
MLSVFTSNDTLHLNDDRLGDAVLEGNATYPLPTYRQYQSRRDLRFICVGHADVIPVGSASLWSN